METNSQQQKQTRGNNPNNLPENIELPMSLDMDLDMSLPHENKQNSQNLEGNDKKTSNLLPQLQEQDQVCQSENLVLMNDKMFDTQHGSNNYFQMIERQETPNSQNQVAVQDECDKADDFHATEAPGTETNLHAEAEQSPDYLQHEQKRKQEGHGGKFTQMLQHQIDVNKSFPAALKLKYEENLKIQVTQKLKQKREMYVSLKTVKLNIPRPPETDADKRRRKNSNNPSAKDLIKEGGTIKIQKDNKNWWQRWWEDQTRVPYKEMDTISQQKRINYLWGKLRTYVRLAGLLRKFKSDREPTFEDYVQKLKLKHNAIGIDDESDDESNKINRQPWYLLQPDTTSQKAWRLIIQAVNWSVAAQLPLCFVWRDLKEQTIIFWWVTDILWCIEILSKFIRATPHYQDFKSISYHYIKSGDFFIDCIATIPTLATGQVVDWANFCKFLRLRDFFQMFGPFIPIIERIMPPMDTHIRSTVINFFMMIVGSMLMAHFAACIWLILGLQDQEEPPALQMSWCTIPDFDGYQQWEMYVFSYYWIFQVITTVGYGDYPPQTTNEQVFALIVEFFGMTFFSLLMGIVSNFMATFNTGFQSLVQARLSACDQWVRKIERSNQPRFMNPMLYYQITTQIQDAFMNDFNLIIEEGCFYQQLTPRMQTQLVKSLLGDFVKQFNHFFDSCEEGFLNECIINMLARIRTKNSIVQEVDKAFREIYFIREGCVGVFDEKGKGPYLILPQYSFFGDYQIIFQLRSLYNYKTYLRYDRMKTPTENEKLEQSTVFMCIESKVFLNLCELYPRTATNLKFRALERREQVMKHFKLTNRLKFNLLSMKNSWNKTPSMRNLSNLANQMHDQDDQAEIMWQRPPPEQTRPFQMY